MTLSDLLLTPANIQTLQNQFGLSRDQTVEAVGALLPAFSAGLKRNVATGQQAASFVEALATGRHGRYAETPETAATKKGRREGDEILSHLFGRKKVSREVAARASATTGIGADLLKQMLPVIASMVMGALFKGATGSQGGGLGKALGGAAGGGLLGTLIEGLAGGALSGGRQSTQAGGGPLGDLLGQVLQGGLGGLGGASGRAVPQSGQGSSLDGGLGDLLGQILGGARGAREPRQPRAEAPMPSRSPREPRAPRGTGRGGLQDIFGDMLEPGRAANPRARTGSVIDELLGN